MSKVQSFNEYIDSLFSFWNGEITEEELSKNPHFGITEEVDGEMQKDSFY